MPQEPKSSRHKFEPLSSKVIAARRVNFRTWDEDDELLLETKAEYAMRPDDADQSLRYVTKGNYKTILLVNYGQKPLGIRRFVNGPTKRPV